MALVKIPTTITFISLKGFFARQPVIFKKMPPKRMSKTKQLKIF